MPKKVLVAGGAGFIGSHLVERLSKDKEVTVLDNLSSGNTISPNCNFFKVDIARDPIDDYFNGVEEVWHLVANPNIRSALTDPSIDMDTITGMFRILEAMKKSNVKRIIYTSSSTVYGDAEITPTPESYSPMLPVSLYGASKLAGEALISSYAGTFGFNAVIFRLSNIVGPRLKRGIVYDFINKLKANPSRLEILGDGSQPKTYVYVDDLMDAMFLVKSKVNEGVEIFNVGNKDTLTSKDVARIVSNSMGLNPEFNFAEGRRGWPGDVPKNFLDISRITSYGWKPKHNSEEAVKLMCSSMKLK